MGTPDFAAPSLKMLIGEGYEVPAVVTQPDRPKGRGGKSVAPVIKRIAEEAGIRVLQPYRPEEICDIVSGLAVDLCVTAAYGCILRKKFLRIPRLGTVNVHASLLPLYRGPSPIHMALLNGDAQTGVTTMLTESGVDTGPILMSGKIQITDGMYFAELHDALAELGAVILKETVREYLSGRLEPVPQDGSLASYAPMIRKDAGVLDFSLGAERLVNTVRAVSAWPGAYARVGTASFKVHRAAYENNAGVAIGGPSGPAAGGPPGPAAGGPPAGMPARPAGSAVRVDRSALSVLCGDGNLFNITRLQFENGRVMDISECWHNLRNIMITS